MSTTLHPESRPVSPPEPAGKKAPAGQTPPATAPRLVSLDAYRGFIMLAMASAGLGFAQVAQRLDTGVLASSTVLVAGSSGGPLQAAGSLIPDRAELLPPSPVWAFLGFHGEHVAWLGGSFWDMIQPSFMFMVGVALPYSVASRRARGESYGRMVAHAIWRAALLILLAVFLSSPMTLSSAARGWRGPTTNWVFTNVLAQIGMGYVFVFLLVGRGLKVQLAALAAILGGSILLFGLYPAPGPDYPWARVGVPDDWKHLTGWFAHWDKNSNFGHAFDVWFLNLFPRAEPFDFNRGGYQTLNFVPSMATMTLGLLAGEMLRNPERGAGAKVGLLILAGLACLGLGWGMGQTLCPIVKRIWTPSWAVYSSSWTFLMLAGFYLVIDVVGWKGWAFPLVVVGMNSIAMYVMSQMLKPWVARTVSTHAGGWIFQGDYGVVMRCAVTVFVLWCFCLWLYRRKIFLRI